MDVNNKYISNHMIFLQIALAQKIVSAYLFPTLHRNSRVYLYVFKLPYQVSNTIHFPINEAPQFFND